jgi:hypothetical protein
MAVSVKTVWTLVFGHFNNTNHPDLTPQLLIISRFLAISSLAHYFLPFGYHIPYLSILVSDQIPYDTITKYAFLIGCALISLTNYIRWGAVLCGLALWMGFLLCRPCLSNAHMFLASIFIVTACSNYQTGNRLLQAQVIILYLGSCAVKLVDIDWWNGQYFDTLMISRHHIQWYINLATQLPDKALSTFMGIFVIVVELLIPICFLKKKWWHKGVVLAISFHTIMIFIMQSTFRPFYFSLLGSFMVFTTFPIKTTVYNRILYKFREYLPQELVFIKNRLSRQPFLSLKLEDKTTLKGYYAVACLCINNPISWYAFAVLSSFYNSMLWIYGLHLFLLPYYLYLMRKTIFI